MDGDFTNVYDDPERARAYAQLDFPGTYFLAFRDLPALLARHVRGTRALDFGCGAGRSSRFLRGLGFEVTGVDIAAPMLEQARERDPRGDYRLVADGDPDALPDGPFDLVLSAFTFDNVPTRERKVALFASLGARLTPAGRIVSVVSAPEIYRHEWASFSTRDYPENRDARAGETVRIVMLDVPDARPVEDVVWPDADYLDVYRAAALEPLACERPLGREGEPVAWVSETRVAPWVHWVLGRAP